MRLRQPGLTRALRSQELHPKKPVSQREDAITQKRLSQIVPASAVMDEAVWDPVLLPHRWCLSASPVPMLGDARQGGGRGAGQTSHPHPPLTSKQC